MRPEGTQGNLTLLSHNSLGQGASWVLVSAPKVVYVFCITVITAKLILFFLNKYLWGSLAQHKGQH